VDRSDELKRAFGEEKNFERKRDEQTEVVGYFGYTT
jgi:hypothetical protein